MKKSGQGRAGPVAAAKDVAENAADEVVLRLHDYNELVAASARSAAQHERIVRAAGLSLTGAGLSLLGLVARHGPIAVGDVARRAGVTASTVSRQLRPIEDLLLIEREIDSGDARIARLKATRAGLRALDRAREVMLNDYRVALREWSSADLVQLGTLLVRLRNDLMRTRTDESGWSVPIDELAANG
jgi:DNA-binding MarR family transcriptional regulator